MALKLDCLLDEYLGIYLSAESFPRMRLCAAPGGASD